MQNNIRVQRFAYLIAFFILIVIEVLIARYVHDDFIRPYVGDILVVILVYCFARVFRPKGFKLMPLYVFAFATIVEILQYFRFIEIFNLQNSAFFRVLLGSVFDIKDIVCYGIGCLLLMIYEKLILRNK